MTSWDEQLTSMEDSNGSYAMLDKIITGIMNGDFDDVSSRIEDALRTRRRFVADQQASINRLTLSPGDKVRLKGLSPKYLNGLTGTVESNAGRTRGSKTLISVTLDESVPPWHQARRRYGNTLYAPASCIEAI